MAKQAVRVADGCHQELLTHLAFTHLVIEPFVIARPWRGCASERHRQVGEVCPRRTASITRGLNTCLRRWGCTPGRSRPRPAWSARNTLPSPTARNRELSANPRTRRRTPAGGPRAHSFGA
jgi:hypothetical protein